MDRVSADKLLKLSADRVVAIGRESFGAGHLERALEDIVEKAPAAFLGFDVLLIGRQVRTSRGVIDLLALDEDGNTVIIELKPGDSPREIVSQANSYQTHFRHGVREDDLNALAEKYFKESSGVATVLRKKFKERFGRLPRCFNGRQIIVLVAERFDDHVLPELEILSPVCVEFSYYSKDSERYLSVRRVIGEPSKAAATIAPSSNALTDYDRFLRDVADQAWSMLPSDLNTFKTTFGHWPKAQNVRFHWGPMSVHIGLYVEREKEGDELSIYFMKDKADPRITALLKVNEKSIRERLALKAQELRCDDPREMITQSLGRISARDTDRHIQPTAVKVRDYIGVLKPLLADLL